MKYRIKHVTEYRYEQAVSQCYNIAHLLPRDTATQRCEKTELTVSPETGDYREHPDSFGNRQSYFEITESHKKLLVTAESIVGLSPASDVKPPLLTIDEVRRILTAPATLEDIEAKQFLLPSPFIQLQKAIREYGEKTLRGDREMVGAINELMTRIFKEFTYDPGFTDTATPLTTVLEHRRGVCQDFAHLAIACLRANGLAARYVSGYLETIPPPGEKKLEGADESHAWFAVYVPGYGWIDFDPTNNVIPSDKHITVAWGRDYSDVSPLKGIIYGGGKHTLKVSVTVQSLNLVDNQQQQQQQ